MIIIQLNFYYLQPQTIRQTLIYFSMEIINLKLIITFNLNANATNGILYLNRRFYIHLILMYLVLPIDNTNNL